MNINKKIKKIRILKNLTQIKFAKLLNIGLSTIVNYENNFRTPNGEVLRKPCNKFPEYTLWLMTDDVDIKDVENLELS